MLADGDIDSPEKWARTSQVHSDFDAAKRELGIQLRDASSVDAAAAVAPGQGPKEFVYVRVKEGPKGLIPCCDLVSESFTTYPDLATCAVLSSSAEDWKRLQSYPTIVETFCDHNETQQSLVAVAIGARQR